MEQKGGGRPVLSDSIGDYVVNLNNEEKNCLKDFLFNGSDILSNTTVLDLGDELYLVFICKHILRVAGRDNGDYLIDGIGRGIVLPNIVVNT